MMITSIISHMGSALSVTMRGGGGLNAGVATGGISWQHVWADRPASPHTVLSECSISLPRRDCGCVETAALQKWCCATRRRFGDPSVRPSGGKASRREPRGQIQHGLEPEAGAAQWPIRSAASRHRPSSEMCHQRVRAHRRENLSQHAPQVHAKHPSVAHRSGLARLPAQPQERGRVRLATGGAAPQRGRRPLLA
eukprot:COSAG01_NODE_6316_length_3740_cov_2.298270_2_plen_195_part_00